MAQKIDTDAVFCRAPPGASGLVSNAPLLDRVRKLSDAGNGDGVSDEVDVVYLA